MHQNKSRLVSGRLGLIVSLNFDGSQKIRVFLDRDSLKTFGWVK